MRFAFILVLTSLILMGSTGCFPNGVTDKVPDDMADVKRMGNDDRTETFEKISDSSYPAPVAKTGDRTDGNKGVAWPVPRFTDNRDETVTDNLTGLMWTKNANMAADRKTWEKAKNYCKKLSHAGYDDWRLPNINELLSLIDRGKSRPALPKGYPFFNVQDSYWSSTAYSGGTFRVWIVYLPIGYMLKGRLFDTHVVWPIRSQ